MGLVLVLMETVMDPVGFYWSLSIGGLLKPMEYPCWKNILNS